MHRNKLFRLLHPLTLSIALAPAAHAASTPNYHPAIDPHHVEAVNVAHPIDLTANWLVHPGDDPTFASPTLDDSHWLVIDVYRSLPSYGFEHPDFMWYRTHLHISPNSHNMAIDLRYFLGSEQVFVNGVLTGPSREFPPGGLGSAEYNLQSSIPDALIASGDVTIAIRAELKSAGQIVNTRIGLTDGSLVLFGDERVLRDRASLFTFRGQTSQGAIAFLTALILLIAAAFAVSLRDEPEYIALCIFVASQLSYQILRQWRGTHEMASSRWELLPTQLLTLIWLIAGMEFARMILKLPRSRWIVAYEWILATLLLVGSTLDVVLFNVVAGPPRIAFLFIIGAVTVIVAPLILGLPIFALWIWRRDRNTDALLLSIPLLVQGFFFYIQIGLTILRLLHLTQMAYLPPIPIQIFDIAWDEVADFLFLLALLMFLILRTVRLARTRAALAAEFAAAQHVQHLLLTGSSHPTPGFVVETAFHPAAEVGGVFFLVTPFEDGSLLAIVGDVSGKGLTAAMRVAMILGILRRETSREPAAVLAHMNDALLSQSEMGFTTACCVHLFPDGRFTAANAGHIAPYIAGAELETPPALPLGLAPDQFYDFITGQLAPGQTLVLLSDGVPEARNAKRELYGFDRLPILTLLPASDIADTALRFGQEDDITVLTLAVA
jgi:sigma-B regulation protein RsbU (phosphoserine phosphatase)